MSGFTVRGTIFGCRTAELAARRICYNYKKYFKMKKILTKHLKKYQYWVLPSVIVIDALFFGFTDPHTVNSQLLIVGYILAVITIYVVLRVLGRLAALYGVPRAGARRFSSIATGVIGICLALSSMGELTARDITVMVPLAALLYVYLYYARTREA